MLCEFGAFEDRRMPDNGKPAAFRMTSEPPQILTAAAIGSTRRSPMRSRVLRSEDKATMTGSSEVGGNDQLCGALPGFEAPAEPNSVLTMFSPASSSDGGTKRIVGETPKALDQLGVQMLALVDHKHLTRSECHGCVYRLAGRPLGRKTGWGR